MVTPEEIAQAMAVHSVDDEGRVQIDSEDAVAVVPVDGDSQHRGQPTSPAAGAVGVEDENDSEE